MVWLGILLLGGSMFLLGGLIVGVLVFGSTLWWGEEEFAAAEHESLFAASEALGGGRSMGVYASERLASVEDDDGDDAGDALDPRHG